MQRGGEQTPRRDSSFHLLPSTSFHHLLRRLLDTLNARPRAECRGAERRSAERRGRPDAPSLSRPRRLTPASGPGRRLLGSRPPHARRRAGAPPSLLQGPLPRPFREASRNPLGTFLQVPPSQLQGAFEAILASPADAGGWSAGVGHLTSLPRGASRPAATCSAGEPPTLHPPVRENRRVGGAPRAAVRRRARQRSLAQADRRGACSRLLGHLLCTSPSAPFPSPFSGHGP